MQITAKKFLPDSGYDQWLLIPALGLMLIGLLMVASASMDIAERQFHQPFHFFFRQFIYLILGLLFTWLFSRIELKILQEWSVNLLLIGLLMALLVLIPGIGRVVNGSRRWLNLMVLHVQVSELVKLLFIIYLADYLNRRQEEVRTRVRGFLKPFLLLVVLCGLLLLEPDFGAAVVLTSTAMMMIFVAGVRWTPYVVLLAIALAVFSLLAVISPYRMARLTSFLDPWSRQFDTGYQLTQSLIAFGYGGWFGVGLGESVQKLFYLPEAHTDFLFAVLAEELGLTGVFMVLALFMILIGRGMWIARRAIVAGEGFAGYLAYGLSFWIAMQAAVNIGVTIGVLPTKGLTLPFMSYGGSSLLVTCFAFGLLLRVDLHLKKRLGSASGPRLVGSR